MIPPCQSFKTTNATCREIDDRLIVRTHRSVRDCLTQITFDPCALLNLFIHFRLEKAEITAAVGLRPIQSNVRPPHYVLRQHSVLGRYRDANRGAERDLYLSDVEWPLE